MIRAITVGLPLFASSTSELSESLVSFRSAADQSLKAAGLEPRTVRITLPAPSADMLSSTGALSSLVRSVEDLAATVGARWYCLPLDLVASQPAKDILAEASGLLARNSKLFVNLMVADAERISMTGANIASNFILNLARRSSSGLDCFRAGVSARCPAGTPFFPFSRHDGDDCAFSIAMETTEPALDVAKRARSGGSTLQEFQSKLVDTLSAKMRIVDNLGSEISARSGVRYRGLDASFAPFPDGKTSVAELVRLMGPDPVGTHGSVFATSVLTDALALAGQHSGAQLAGFNGVMYSVLEDDGLAHANDLRAISLSTLALLSTVCACGIDMVPVPTTMYSEELAALILDISALAVRLQKPLGVRVLPIPNRMVNERTQFNLDFLCDSRVMDTGSSASKPMPQADIWRYGSKQGNS